MVRYSKANPPLACIHTQCDCYKAGVKMHPLGFVVHSTAANNTSIARYVQPSANDPNRTALLAKIGTNRNGNAWNQPRVYVYTDGTKTVGWRDTNKKLKQVLYEPAVHAFIGKIADGTVAAVQTLPWDMRCWGCGSGSKGSCNSAYVQFEICEDARNDPAYLSECYAVAADLIAYLCGLYGLNPDATATVAGVKCPVIVDHAGAHTLGLASNHADVGHWFPLDGKSMATLRADVKTAMSGTATPKPAAKPRGTMTEKQMWDRCKAEGLTDAGAAGLMGNLYAESGLSPTNLQNTGNTKLSMTDAAYTDAVDAGTYTASTFSRDGYGYGLAQWTYSTRKAALKAATDKAGKSIGDASAQFDFLFDEMAKSFPAVLKALRTAKTVREASDAVLLQYERPANTGTSVQAKRAGYGDVYYAKYAGQAASAPAAGDDGYIVIVTASVLNVRTGPGTSYTIARTIKNGEAYTIVETRGDWGKLKSGAGWICLDYTKRK